MGQSKGDQRQPAILRSPTTYKLLPDMGRRDFPPRGQAHAPLIGVLLLLRRVDGEDVALALRGVIEGKFLSLRRPLWRSVAAVEIR